MLKSTNERKKQKERLTCWVHIIWRNFFPNSVGMLPFLVSWKLVGVFGYGFPKPNHHIRFRKCYETVKECHRLEELCEIEILQEISKALDNTWRNGLRLKLKQILPKVLCTIINVTGTLAFHVVWATIAVQIVLRKQNRNC